MLFCKYNLCIDSERLMISCKRYFVYESPYDDPPMVGSPKCWDDTFFNRININNYAIYHICGKLVFSGSYNSVSDFKKIWKLANIQKGEFEGSYFTEKGKVYFGITKGYGEESFYSSDSSIMVLLPKEMRLDYFEVFSEFEKNKVEFLYGDATPCLKHLAERYKDSFVLYYIFDDGDNLTVFGSNCGRMFVQSDLKDWPTVDPILVYRK